MKFCRMRNMSDWRPCSKSPHGGKFLNAVIAKLSERVHATNGNPCFAAGRNRLPPSKLITTPSLTVNPCALLTVSANPAAIGTWQRHKREPSFVACIGRKGTQCGSLA